MRKAGYILCYSLLIVGFGTAAIGLGIQSRNNSDSERMIIATGMGIALLGNIMQIILKKTSKKSIK